MSRALSRWLGLGALGASCLLLLAGCRKAPAPAPEKSGGAPLEVKVARPERKTVRHTIEQPGYNAEALQHAPLYARVPGYVGKLNVDIGERVTEGQVLVEQDVPELAAELKQKTALVKQAESEVKQASKTLAAAEAALKSAAALVKQAEAGRLRVKAEHKRAKSTAQRLTGAGRGGVIDRESVAEAQLGLEAAVAALEEVEAKVQSAEAAHDESASRRDKAEADVEVAAARVDVAKAGRDYADKMLGYAKIKAPFNGVVTQRNVDVGYFLQPTGGKGEPLLVVENTDTIRVFLNVPELESVWVRQPAPGKLGIPVRVRGQGLGGRIFPGHVKRTALALDPRSRTLRTEIDLRNPDGYLRPGMYVYAALDLERPGVWALPAAAVVLENGEAHCFRVENGKAVRTPLIVGLRGGGLIEVQQKQTSGKGGWEGITGSEEIITIAAAVKEGQAVARGK